ncbi:MAG: SBBP repeat-containing protein [Acidobacteriota bacterium]|nr:SBBP repeat-containing protein [Acidobacteriota bacterium]
MMDNFCKGKAEKFVFGLTLSLMVGFFIFYGFTTERGRNAGETGYRVSAKPEVASYPVKTNFGELPLSFELNAGQTDEQVKFLSRGQGFTLFLTGRETVLSLRKGSGDGGGGGGQSPNGVLRLRLEGANQEPEVVGQDELAGKSNYFIGDDPDEWKTGVPNFSRVRYREVYPGIDQVFYGNGKKLEYDFIVSPGADFEQIALVFEGASDLKLAADGDLVLKIGGEEIRQQKPFVYQEIDGERREIAAAYSIRDAAASQSGVEDRRVRFEIGDYDRSKPLVIDPVLLYSTYLGGNGADSGTSIAIDAQRNVYVTGATSSTNFPTVNPLQANNASPGVGDVFVTKINAAGNQIV